MTDKQIIIDGIDVAGCVYYKQECIANCGMFALGDFKCEGQICLYKQLKRKEQECEELKKRLESFQKDYSKLYQVVENKGYIKELDQLKQILAEIKEIAKGVRNYLKYPAPKDVRYEMDIILQKISESEGYDERF